MKTGDMIPDFTLPDKDGMQYCFSQRKNEWTVLYFYPKDHTPGCTLEGMEFTSLLSQFEDKGAEIVGVSRDSPATHCRFSEKNGLRVRLLSDSDGSVHQLFGAWGRKKMMGREFEGALRTTFLIGPDKRVRAVWEKVKASGHAQEVLKRLSEETR